MSQRPQPQVKKKGAWILPCILAAVVAIYFRGLFGGYTFDDFPNIVDNEQLHVSTLSVSDWWAAIFSSPASELQRPLAMFTFAINIFFTGLDPFPIKATNLAIHLLNVLLACWLARELIGAWAMRHRTEASLSQIEGAALTVTALWALAPINLTPVLLSVQRMESLAQVFVFVGLALYVAGRQRQLEGKRGWVRIFSGVALATGLGLLAKETAAAIPLYALIIECLLFGFLTREGKRDNRLFLFYAAVLLLPLVAGSAWLLPWALSPASYASRPFTLAERLLTESRVIWSYVEWTLVPNLGELSLYHDDYAISRNLLQPIWTIVAVLGLVAAVVTAVMVRKRRPLTALGMFLFLAAHALTGTIIPLELIYEHRNYFASFALMLVVVDVIVLGPGRRFHGLVRAIIIAAMLGFFSVTTLLRANEWGDPVRFAISEAAKHPLSPRATYDEGRTYVILSNFDSNSAFFPLAKQALISASRVPNATALPEQALLILASRSRTQADPDWWRDMRQKFKQGPMSVQEVGGLYALSQCQESGKCNFDRSDMLETFYAAVGSGKSPSDVLTIFANYAINVLHDYDLAIRLMQGALEASPKNLQYHENLARALIFLRRFDEAQGEIEKMQQLNHLGTSNAPIRATQKRLQDAKNASSQ